MVLKKELFRDIIIKEYTENKKSCAEIGKIVNLSPDYIKKILNKNGINTSSKGKLPKNINQIAGWNRGNKDHIKKKCEVCEKEFEVTKSRINQRFCSKKCRGIGKRPWNYKKKGLQVAWNKDIKLPDDWVEKLRLAKLGKIKEQANNWQGGVSFEPYTTDWTETLKRAIRERDRYTCKLCGNLQTNKAFHVHHIDYDKKNCNSNNLTSSPRSPYP